MAASRGFNIYHLVNAAHLRWRTNHHPLSLAKQEEISLFQFSTNTMFQCKTTFMLHVKTIRIIQYRSLTPLSENLEQFLYIWDLTKLYFMARLYVELLDIKEQFPKVLLMIDYLLCHGLSDSVSKKNWIILFFLSRNMNRQKLKRMSYPISSIVTTSLGT